MPELPEVETTLRGITPHIDQQTIAKVIVRQPRLRWPISTEMPQDLLGQTIISLTRRAKYLLLTTHAGTLAIHLGMSGTLRILTQHQAPGKHDHVDLIFAHGKILRFMDPRRFGAFLWIKDNPEQHPLLHHLGVEPLHKDFSAKYLWNKTRGKSITIKSLLMDSKIVVGIGNIYAAEALFMARIHPTTPANSLTIKRLANLVIAIKQILRHAIKKGGTTLKDFTDSNGKPGYFATQLKVYGRDGLPCVICRARLHLVKIGQRSTVYCKRCQR
jgi:formamidopyrimidine-DNA glycosylase